MKKAEADKDEPKVAELNRLKVDYEQTVSSFCVSCCSCWKSKELTDASTVCYQIFGFVEECDRRIRAAQRRLEKTPEENNRTTNLVRAA